MIEVSSNPFYKISEVIKKYEKSIEYIARGLVILIEQLIINLLLIILVKN